MKHRILTCLVTILLLCCSLCVSASASDYDAVAEELSAIGMFRGTGSGFELDRAPTRSEAAIMLVRLFGAEEEANAAYQAGKISHPFTDVSAYTSPYVAWLHTNGITKGYTATTFASQNPCSAQNYAVFLLRALGYRDGTDFAYADALRFAEEKGFYNPSLFSGTFLRDDLAALTYLGLAADMEDGKTYLLDSLIDSGAVDADAAASMKESFKLYRAKSSGAKDAKSLLDFTVKEDKAPSGTAVNFGLGTLKGSESSSQSGKKLETYKGIPYGKFDKRFDNAYLYQDALGTFDATKAGPLSYQKGAGRISLENEYDCLNLDIWTPNSTPDELMPVYVFIHGGANTSGQSGSVWYNLSNVAAEGVVCVSLNYRLGVHGFSAFKLDDGTLVTNQAISDLIVGLQWVQKYIAAFGGDPDQVTLGGQSAGAYNVSYLINSPKAAGLFDRAILQSGGDLGLSMDEAVKITMEYAAYISGKKVTSSQQAYEILSKEDAYSLATDYTYVHNAADSFYIYNSYPVNDGVYLPLNPEDNLGTANCNNVDILVGQNEHEHAMYTHSFYGQALSYFDFLITSYCGEQYIQEMRDYFGLSARSTKEEIREAITAFGNISFLYDSYLVADAMADAGQKVYMYRFGYGKENVTDSFNANNYGATCGAIHSSELPFVHRMAQTYFHLTPAGTKLMNQMHKAWVSFIKYGDPNGETGNTLSVKWKEYDSTAERIMSFENTTGMSALKNTVDASMIRKVLEMMYDYPF